MDVIIELVEVIRTGNQVSFLFCIIQTTQEGQVHDQQDRFDSRIYAALRTLSRRSQTTPHHFDQTWPRIRSVVPIDLYERMTGNEDPRRAYGPGEMPRDLADMFMEQLDKDSAEHQASKDD